MVRGSKLYYTRYRVFRKLWLRRCIDGTPCVLQQTFSVVYPLPPSRSSQTHHCCMTPPKVGIPIAVSGAATPENKVTNWSLSFTSKKVGTRCRSPSHERFLGGCSSTFMRLALGGNNVCLVGEPDVLRPGIVGMRGSMVIRLRPFTN